MDKGFDRLLRTWKAHAKAVRNPALVSVCRSNLRQNRDAPLEERFVMKNTVGLDRSAMIVPNWEFTWWAK